MPTWLLTHLAGVALAQNVTNLTTGDTFSTLGAAVDAALAGQTLQIAAGRVEDLQTVAIDKSLTLVGAGSELTTLAVRPPADGVIALLADVTITGVRIETALDLQQSAVFASFGEIRLEDVAVDVLGQGFGIGVVNAASLALTDVRVTAGAQQRSALPGPGIRVYGTASATLTDVTVAGFDTDLDGGALHVDASAVVCDGCRLVGNHAGGEGGAASVTATGSLELRRSRLCANSAGGLASDVSGSGTVLVESTLIAQGFDTNTSMVASGGDWTVRNNHFLYGQGGVWNDGAATFDVRNNLFLENRYGGVVLFGASTAGVQYNAFAGNGAVTDAPFGLDATNLVEPVAVGGLLTGWNGDCEADLPWPTPFTSPLVDAGDPALVDPDGSRADIGMYGGAASDPTPHTDGDGDGGSLLRDCDDQDPANGLDLAEVCDAQDNDCDTLVDDADDSADPATMTAWYADCDLDGQGVAGVEAVACAAPAAPQACPSGGWAAQGPLATSDCDDGDATVGAGFDDACGDGVDQDCSGVDGPREQEQTWLPDADGDGFGDPEGAPRVDCYDLGYAGYVPEADAGDCDDADRDVHPDAAEVCNGADDDCDGAVDDVDGAGPWYADADGDGHGAGAPATDACAPDGWVSAGDDCDDADADVWSDCGDGGTTGTDPGGDGGGGEGGALTPEKPAGCGCAAGARGGWGALVLSVGLGLRGRRRVTPRG